MIKNIIIMSIYAELCNLGLSIEEDRNKYFCINSLDYCKDLLKFSKFGGFFEKKQGNNYK